MEWRRTTTRAVLASLLLLGAAACGDDDDGGPGSIGTEGSVSQDGGGAGDDAASTGDSGAGSGTGIDGCTLLQAAEIEAQFAEVGPVGEGVNGDIDRGHCLWEAEENGASQADIPPPEFWLNVQPRFEGTSVDGALGDPVAVDGLGDEAYFEGDTIYASLYVGADDLLLSLGANTRAVSIDTGMQDRLVALAELALGRL